MKPRFPATLARLGLYALLATSAAAPALAQSPAQTLLDGKFVVSLGAFVVGTDTKAALNGSSATNPEVDFDQTFGNDSDNTRWRLDALWRITPAHHLRFLYFDNSVNRTRAIDRTINWGDYTFAVGATVESEVKNKIYELVYEWAFVRQPTLEVAGTAGLHVMDITTRLSGNASLNGAATQFSSKQNSVTAPLPVIGIRAGWVVAPQWYLDASAQFFKINVNEYDGRLSDLRAGATWMFSPNFGVGLGYNSFVTKVDVTKDNFNGRLRLGYSGLQMYLTGAF